MADEDIREERLIRDLKTKKVYHFIDTEKRIDQKCREVFKNKDVEIHYPIAYDGGSKYNKAKKFTYEGFNGYLPIGIQKSPYYGLGFTNTLKCFIEYIEAKLVINEICFRKNGKSILDKENKRLVLVEKDLRDIYNAIKNVLDKQKDERQRVAEERMNQLFPNEIRSEKRKYIKNSIATALSAWEQSLDEFSDKDKRLVKDLFDKLALTENFFNTETLLKTKETVDATYIDDVIIHFEALMGQKNETRTLEKKWQSFLKEHSWIFSYIFSFPIILLQDEAYVGGKNISNKDGKVTDFIVKNNLTENVAFIEIKTHRTELLKKGRSYRGSDVFAMSSDLSGGITQVLNQRDNFQKHFATHKLNSSEPFETFNSKCVVLMGSLNDLDDKQVQSFELFRSNSRDVEILTFDELLARFKHIKTLMAGNVE